MAENERLKKVILWLISQGIVKSQEDLAIKLNYNPSSVSQIVAGIKPLSRKFANRISDFSNKINIDYLFGNNNAMLNNNVPIVAVDNNTTIYKELLEKKEIEIKELCREVGALSNQNTNLDKNLAALRLELECCKKENLELRGIINSQPNSSEDMPELPDIPAQLVAARAEFRQDNKN